MDKKEKRIFSDERPGDGSVPQCCLCSHGQDLMQIPTSREKIFCDEAIEELSGSIREYGVLQPIILKAGGDKYTIIAGERRYRAATMARPQRNTGHNKKHGGSGGSPYIAG